MNPDFVDLLRAFRAAEVRFLVAGAYALAVHGRPRATGDLDVWVDATRQRNFTWNRENTDDLLEGCAKAATPTPNVRSYCDG
jgi:hypothetical protein